VAFDAVTAVALTASGHSPMMGSGTALKSEIVCCDFLTVDELFFFAQQS
jgi:hypothetical protein